MRDSSADASEAERRLDAAARDRSYALSLADLKIARLPFLGSVAEDLRAVDLTGCEALTDVQGLEGLAQLKVVSLRWCSALTNVQGLAGLTQLQVLDLTGCRALTDLNALVGLRQLRSLDLLRCAGLTDLQGLAGLENLESLDFPFCRALTDVQVLAGLTKLQVLDLRLCHALTDVQGLAGLTKLQSLNLSGCDALTDVQVLAGLTQLKSLDLSGCGALTDVQVLAGLTQLKSLDLSGCDALTDVQVLAGLTNLQSLKLSGCRALTDVQGLASLTNLQSLDLSGCYALTDVQGLASLTNLQSLKLSGCDALTDVQGLADLTNLQVLDLTRCRALTDLQDLEALKALRQLRLRDVGPLDCAPNAVPLCAWHQLDKLNARNLRSAPNELGSARYADNALPRIRAWQEDLARGEALSSMLKVFVVGNGGVGKTQLCRRLRGEIFDPMVPSTHGISIDRFQLVPQSGECPSIEANVWDFGGQDIYLGTHALFLDERAIYVIAWSPEKENSAEFEQQGIVLRNRPLSYWIEYVHSLAGSQVPVIVVQTQCDREMYVRSPPLPAHRFERLVTVASSSHPDGIGIERLQLELQGAARYQWERYGKVRLPASWVAVRDTLHRLKDEKSLSRERFDALCNSHHAATLPDVVLEYLHRSGQVFWRDGAFDNHVVIDQSWAFTGIYALLERSRVVHKLRERGGWFTREDLAESIWRSYTEKEQMLFLSMMKQCQACFEVLPGKYIAPVHLPALTVVEQTVQAYWQYATPDVVVEMRYDFLHEGVVRAMLCEIGRQAGVYAVYWAYGVCFYDMERRTKVRIISMLPEATAEAIRGGGWIQVEAVGDEALALTEHLVRSIKWLRIGCAPEVIWYRQRPSYHIQVDPKEKPFTVIAGLPDDVPAFLREHIAKWQSGILVVNVEGNVVVKDQMNISNSPGASVAQGGSSVSGNTVTVTWTQAAAQLNLTALAAELSLLRAELRSRSTGEVDHDMVVADVGQAEKAANDQDGVKALKHLKAAGQWALDTATKIGTAVAAKAIEHAMRLPS